MLLSLLVALLNAPACPSLPAAPACAGALPVYADGCPQRWVCPADLAGEGLTRVDLSDTWLPTLFQAGTDDEQPYRAVYQKLAAGLIKDDAVEARAATDQFFETYGIFPDLSLVRTRLLDAERHTCRDAVDDKELAAYDKVVSAYEPTKTQRKRVKSVERLERLFRRELAKRAKKAKAARRDDQRDDAATDPPKPAETDEPVFGPDDFDTLGEEKRWAWSVRKWRRQYPKVAAVRAAQAHLKCERLMERIRRPGIFDYRTFVPLQAYQRKLMLGSRSHLDAPTRAVLVEDSREADFRALLRALRERVIEATGLIEDGSARGAWGTVFGRALDTAEYRHAAAGVPLANGADDFISPATEAAAKALGWTSPEAAIERLTRQTGIDTLAIAVKLPALPPWHAEHMTLRAEVDRGDVWYDYPYRPSGKPRYLPVKHRPHITLYAQHGEREIALVRWPTTIGGWKKEVQPDGTLGMQYKNSDVGVRYWKNLIAGPSWLPPDTTPDETLVERDGRGGYRGKRELLGPSYASAYGLVMLINHKRVEAGDTVKWWDYGIRVHGSVSYRSIVRGTSHGCHRLFNHLAVRLGDFLLKHRKHTIEGPIATSYWRAITHKGRRVTLKVKSRGYGYVLDPPVPVEVLRGRVRGRVRRAPDTVFPVPE